MRSIVAVAIIVAAFHAAALAQSDPAEILLQQASHKQLVEGDLDSAIRLYQRVVAEHPSNRAASAKALLQIGRAYEKLGKEQARQAYARVVRDYSDQAAAATEARQRLNALERTETKNAITLSARRIWHGAEVNSLGAPTADGRFITATDWGSGNVIIRDLESGTSRPLSGKNGWDSREFAMFSVPSPDGTEVAYAWGYGEYELRVTRVDGTGTRVLTSGNYLQPMAWTPDGKGILTLIWQDDKRDIDAAIVNASNGSRRTVKTFSERQVPSRLSFSPDGKFLTYDIGRDDPLRRDVYVLSIPDGQENILVDHAANDRSPIWSPDGTRILFITERSGAPSLWGIAVAEGKAAGEAKLIKSDMGRVYPTGITRHGSLVYTVEVGSDDIYEATLDPASGIVTGKPRIVASRYVGSNSNAVWSPDGKFFCYISRRGLTIGGDTNQSNVLVIRGPDGKERDIEPVELARFSRPVWTPDGKSILLVGRPRSGAGNNGVYSVDVATGAVHALFIEMKSWVNGIALSPDGRTLYFGRQLGGDEGFALVRRDLATEEETVLHHPADGGGLGIALAVSQDGALLATRVWWVSGPASNAIRIIPTTPGGETREPLGVEKAPSAAGFGFGPVAFVGDGKYLLFGRRRANAEGAVALWRVSVDGGEPSFVGLEMDSLREVSLSPDGRRILFTAGQSSQEIWMMENLFESSSGKNAARAGR